MPHTTINNGDTGLVVRTILNAELTEIYAGTYHLLATGAITGATAQAQAFTFGIKTGNIYPAADSTTAVQILKADGLTSIINVDTTNGRVGIGTTSPQFLLHAFTSSTTDTAMYFDALGANTRIIASSDTSIKVPQIWVTDRTLTVDPTFTTTGNAGMYLDRTTATYATRNDFIIANFIQDKDIDFVTNNATAKGIRMTIKSTGRVGIGTTSPTAYVHIKAGTAAASTAPLKFTQGILQTRAEKGAMEFDGTLFYLSRADDQRETIGTVLTKATTGDPTGAEGLFCINTNDNTFRVYAEGAWRSLATW